MVLCSLASSKLSPEGRGGDSGNGQSDGVVGTERMEEVKWSRMSMDGQEEQHQQKQQQRNSLTHLGTNQLSVHKFTAGERLETEI
ncbi:hypothetical protein niasHS_003871 [Heterodera schachtii]|uniref:Uncharacterized protein n=2 Tax=Heterodera TaxID=34509 RepID=A0ABD2K3N9_HETSC